MENYHESHDIGDSPPELGIDGTNAKNKKRKKGEDKEAPRHLATDAEEGAVLLDRLRTEAEAKGGTTREVLEHSLWQRIIPAPAERPKSAESKDSEKKEAEEREAALVGTATSEEREKEESEDAEQAEIGDEPVTQEAVVREVLSDDYPEIEPNNLKSAALEYIDEQLPTDTKEPAVETFRKSIRHDLAEAPEADVGSAEQPKIGAVIKKAFAEAAREQEFDEPDSGIEASEALNGTVDDKGPEAAERAHAASSEGLELDYEDDDDLSLTGRTARASSAAGGSASGAAGAPPGYGSGYFGPGSWAGGAGGVFGRRPAYAPAPHMETAIAEPETNPRNSIAGPLLLGAAIGYIIGRRGGRKRERKAAEARMLPLQEQLQVKEIEQRAVRAELAKKESQLRQMASEHAAALRASETTTQRIQTERQDFVRRQETMQAAPPKEAPPLPLFERIVETAPLAAAAGLTAEAARHAQSPDESSPAASETFLARTNEQAPLRTQSISERPSEVTQGGSGSRAETAALHVKPVEMMDRRELLEIADKIVDGDTTVAQAFKSSEIGEPSLRRIVAEFQRGGDVHMLLMAEKVKSSFERDPRLRTNALPSDLSLDAAAQIAALQDAQSPQHALSSGLPENEQLLEAPSRNPLLPEYELPKVPPALIFANVTAFIILAILFVVWFVFIR